MSKTREISRRVVTDLFGPPAERNFDVRYWDGTSERAGTTTQPRFTLVLRHPGALRKMLVPPTERALGEAFVRGDVDVEGNLEIATGLAHRIRARCRAPARFLRILAALRSLPADSGTEAGSARNGSRVRTLRRKHSLRRDAESVCFHYDVGNDFYRLFLDRSMVYSCAYFRTPLDELDVAQEAKFEHMCRKLHLQPGERLLDIGCGWGGLVEFAARRFGVDAVGVTLSPRQAEAARQRIAEAGLGERCQIHLLDYRALPLDARFDKIVSVGMVEHVGRAELHRYFTGVFRHLEPGGLFLNHGIVSLEPVPAARWLVSRSLRRWSSFIERHVFPDSELVSPVEMVGPAEASGFELRDLENLREHYVLTLRHWVARLEANAAQAIACAGEHVWRTWRLYMAASAHAFATGRIAVLQALLARPRPDGVVTLPLTREHLYTPDPWSSPRVPTQPHGMLGAVRAGETSDVAR